jgi:hypothetical protein
VFVTCQEKQEMKIQEQDRFHGAALTQIVEHESFKALNKANERYGHYLINADRHVFVKYRKADATPWSFTFQPEELKAISAELSADRTVYLALVCGTTTICALASDELRAVVNLSATASQWVRVAVPKGGSCHVSGSAGKLNRSVPHNSYPNKLFA